MSPILLGLVLGPTAVALLVIAALLAVAIAHIVTRKDAEIEGRREKAAEAATILGSKGFKRLQRILHLYAIGNLPAVVHEFKSAVSMVLNKKQLEDELREVFDQYLQEEMSDPQRQKVLMDKIAKLQKSNDFDVAANARLHIQSDRILVPDAVPVTPPHQTVNNITVHATPHSTQASPTEGGSASAATAATVASATAAAPKPAAV